MLISLIAAIDNKGCIGKAGALPWRLSFDLQRFKTLTIGHHIIMGRKTWESIGKVLPGRTNIIVTRQLSYHVESCIIAHSIEDALEYARNHEEIEAFVIGGGEIFNTALPFARRIYLTRVHVEIVDADTFFPDINKENWEIIEEQIIPADRNNDFETTFQVLERKYSPRNAGN